MHLFQRRRAARPSPVRSRVATLVWLLAALCAGILAVAALLVALRADEANAAVSFVERSANTLALGVLRPDAAILTAQHDPAVVEAALVAWSVAAVGYLVVGKVLDRLIRP